MTKTS